MHSLEDLKNGVYKAAGLTKLKLTGPLPGFPPEILELGATLEHLDLSGTGLSALPANFGPSLPGLKIAFFSSCNFTTFPAQLASCPNLEMVAFRSNGMSSIPEDSLPPQLRWLILTNNQIAELPSSIGQCHRLQKCMLAGNRLTGLPDAMAQCTKLGLLRLSANRFEGIPAWLFSMPELSFLSFAGNPCLAKTANGVVDHEKPGLAHIPWTDLEVQHTLGEGASGVISQGLWKQSPEFAEEVAIKLFRGKLTSDGTPHDEMEACLAAGSHENLIDVLGRIHGHPDDHPDVDSDAGTSGENDSNGNGNGNGSSRFQGGIVMQLIPPHYSVLGQPPSLTSCTRDTYPSDAQLDPKRALMILEGVAGAARHLHAQGIAHGDVYAHNILANAEDGHALLGDFGAATIYGDAPDEERDLYSKHERLEVLAFAHLVEDVLVLLERCEDRDGHGVDVGDLRRGLLGLYARCAVREVGERPSFAEVEAELQGLIGWSGMMRLAN